MDGMELDDREPRSDAGGRRAVQTRSSGRGGPGGDDTPMASPTRDGAAADHDAHDPGPAHEVPIDGAERDLAQQPGLEPLDLGAGVAQAGHGDERIGADQQGRADGQAVDVETEGGDVLAEVTRGDGVTGRGEHVEELRRDEVDLPQVRLRGIDRDPGAMLDERTGMDVSLDADACDEVEPGRRLLEKPWRSLRWRATTCGTASSKADPAERRGTRSRRAGRRRHATAEVAAGASRWGPPRRRPGSRHRAPDRRCPRDVPPALGGRLSRTGKGHASPNDLVDDLLAQLGAGWSAPTIEARR